MWHFSEQFKALLSLSSITSACAVPAPSNTTLFTSSNALDKYPSTTSAVVPPGNPDNNK